MPIIMTGGDAAHALLGKYLPKPMQAKLTSAAMEAGKAVVPLVRREISSSIAGHGRKPGTLVRRVGVRKKPGLLGGVQVKSTAPHNHLVTRGHRIVTHAGKDTGKRTRPNDFIGRVTPEARVVARVVMQKGIAK
jgi:hypothetical protein